MADQTLSHLQRLRQRPRLARVAREQLQDRLFPGVIQRIEDALLHRDDGRELGEDEPSDGEHVLLALEHPGELRQVGLEPVLLAVFQRRVLEVADHLVDVVFERRHFSRGLHRDRASQVSLGHRGRHFGDGTDLGREIRRELVDVVGQILPGARGPWNARLAAELPFDADLAGHARDLFGKCRQRVDHFVDRVGQGGDLALRLDRQLSLQVAVGDRGHDLGDAADLAGEIARHEIDVVGQILPGSRDTGHLGLSAEFPLRADLARHARHFGGEGGQLVHHRVDRVLQLENLAL